MTNIEFLAAANLFESGTRLGLSALGFIALLALVMGSISAISKVKREGSGAAIMSEVATIVLAVLIGLSVGIAGAVTDAFEDSGIRNPVHTDTVWDR